YMSGAKLGGVDDVAYTWAALNILDACGQSPRDQTACAKWIESLQTEEGGFQDRPGGEPNPVATYYALDSLRLLSHVPAGNTKRAATARRYSIPDGACVFTIQIEAPGKGSPQEAAIMAGALGIHIWAAKNANEEWIQEAQRAAGARSVPVIFAVGDEEYGTYVSVPGLGTYSHLADLIAPADQDFGSPMPKKEHAYPWSEFRDKRITPLRRAKGRMVWQFLENEELTRVLLDAAVASGTYSCISSFHFGNENFLHSQPYLHRWYGRLAMVGLQDAHAAESWWWGDQLAGFRTLFIAKEPTWDAWLEALEKGHVMAVRRDRVTNWKTHLAGGTRDVRDFVSTHKEEWCWWGDSEKLRRPAAVIAVLKPGMAFEAGAPQRGTAIRVRLWSDNSGQGAPQESRANLVTLEIDGRRVQPEFVEAKNDRFHIYRVDPSTGKHVASARVRVLATGDDVSVSEEWEDR
ncbi:MAG: prenyltransferase/squalene oxidase repeat-containing protein, partial [Bryobacteraceae bacterium]